MQNLKTLNEARQIAGKLLNQVKENEPQITTDLQTIASQVLAIIIGLENKFKTEKSLMQKLLLLAEKDKFGIFVQE